MINCVRGRLDEIPGSIISLRSVCLENIRRAEQTESAQQGTQTTSYYIVGRPTDGPGKNFLWQLPFEVSVYITLLAKA